MIVMLNEQYYQEHFRVAFTDIHGRVKSEGSLLRKLYKKCCEDAPTKGLTQARIHDRYFSIWDKVGIRLSCPYIDEIEPAVNALIRPRLNELGYLTRFQEPDLDDKNRLDSGDASGYRAYHCFVKAPAITDIFGNVDLVLCEIQVRSELQHVWADKSHDLLYKPEGGWDLSDAHVLEDMRQLSNHLRVADQLLISIRDRIQGGRDNE